MSDDEAVRREAHAELVESLTGTRTTVELAPGRPECPTGLPKAMEITSVTEAGTWAGAAKLQLDAVLAAAAGAGLGFNHSLFFPVKPKTKPKTRRVGYVVYGSDRKGMPSPRNAPCACGSGLKTKNCHGRRA